LYILNKDTLFFGLGVPATPFLFTFADI